MWKGQKTKRENRRNKPQKIRNKINEHIKDEDKRDLTTKNPKGAKRGAEETKKDIDESVKSIV